MKEKEALPAKTGYRDFLTRWYIGVFILVVFGLTSILYYYLKEETWDSFNYGVSQLGEEMLDEVMDLRDDLDLNDFQPIIWTDSLRKIFKSGIELELVDETFDNKLEDAGYVKITDLISGEVIYQSPQIRQRNIAFNDPQDEWWGYHAFSHKLPNGDLIKGIGYSGVRTFKQYFIGIISETAADLSGQKAKLPYEKAIYQLTEAFDRVADSLYLENTVSLLDLLERLHAWAYVYIYDNHQILWASKKTTAKDIYLPPPPRHPDISGVVRESKSKEYLFDLHDAEGGNYRQFTSLFDIVPTYLYRVDLAIPTDSIKKRLDLLALYFFLGAFILIVSVWGGGKMLLKRALRPVDEIIAAVNEITTKNFEKRLPVAGSADEINRLVITFNQLLDRLAKSFEMQKAFIADASHELRTPLSIMMSDLETALKNYKGENKTASTLQNLIGEIERMARIVEDLNLLSRQDSGQLHMEKKTIRLDDVLLTTVSRCQKLAEKKSITLKIDRAEITEIQGDEELLIRALSNLVNNAVKYTRENSTVTLGLFVEGGKANLSVSDTGAGIAPAHQKKIFDRFYRVDASRSRETGGSGLGLSIAKWICERHQGSISVSSEAGKGSVFTMHLPIHI